MALNTDLVIFYSKCSGCSQVACRRETLLFFNLNMKDQGEKFVGLYNNISDYFFLISKEKYYLGFSLIDIKQARVSIHFEMLLKSQPLNLIAERKKYSWNYVGADKKLSLFKVNLQMLPDCVSQIWDTGGPGGKQGAAISEPGWASVATEFQSLKMFL